MGSPNICWRAALVVCAALGVVSGRAAEDPPPSPPAARGVLIALDTAGRLGVTEVSPEDVEKAPPPRGLFVWPEGDDGERWEVVGPGWKRPAEPSARPTSALLAGHTRGGDAAPGGAEAGQMTVRLEQIDAGTVLRAEDVPLLTPPAGGRLLSRFPTFRRTPFGKEPRFPAATVVVTSRQGGPRLTLRFAVGQDVLRLEDVKDRPKEYAEGLPPGGYLAGNMDFIIEDDETRQLAMRRPDELARLLGTRSDRLYVQFTLERLLGDRQEPYLADALDLLEFGCSPSVKTEVLRDQEGRLRRALAATAGERKGLLQPKAAPADRTGVAEIDEARQLLAHSRWDAALQALDDEGLVKKAASDGRVAGLALLYRGAALAESGAARADEAAAAFEQAQEALKDAPPADRLRGHVNSANFHLRMAQDRLHNHSVQAAAGVRRPVLGTLHSWLAARGDYEAALPLAGGAGAPGAAAAVRVNLARLYALLADVVRTLDPPGAGGRRAFADGSQAASRRAGELAAAAAAGADAPTRAVAEEVRALLAFRDGKGDAAAEAARRALGAYLEAGQLGGAENAYRLLGLTARDRAAAMKHFQVAHLLSEELRERFPPDAAGLSRAGFFARKAYVSDKIVEMLLADGLAAEALAYAELAKARSLQDLLAAGVEKRGRPDARLAKQDDLAALLAAWPADTAALEYFLGTEEAFVFVVDPKGRVTAHKIVDEKGDAVRPRDLIARVRRVLSDMEGHARKLYNQLLSGRGYDHSWQTALHRLANELLPKEVRRALAGAKTVVVVPQHVLHYLPFAALVTQPDPAPQKMRMVRPRFLLDEGYDLVYAPALTAWRARAPGVARQVRAIGLADAPGAPALEGVEKDLKNLKDTFGPRVAASLDGKEAREAGAKRLLGESGVLFFGTHGINVADRPLESYLMLHGEEGVAEGAANADDGRLTAGELFARPIRAELVVMSACYSGLGDRSPLPGDDLFGLQRAFLHSGSRTVVSGLWDVYDGTAPELMLSFFRGLDSGKPAASALCAAHRDFLAKLRASAKDEPWLHPYFWSVYTAAGDDRTRVGK